MGGFLTVTEVVKAHNHEVGKVMFLIRVWYTHLNNVLQETYDHLSRQNQLNYAERQETKEFLQMMVNKKLLQQYLSQKKGKRVI